MAGPDLGATLTTSAVPLTPEQAQQIARTAYGIESSASLLTSERDQNFLLRVAGRPAYVLKATHPAEDPQVTDFQTQIQLHVMRPEFALPVPHLVRTLGAEPVHWHEDRATGRRAVRLITFVDGIPMHEAGGCAELRVELGRVLARFDRSLEGFDHPQAGHVLLWDAQHAPRLRDLIPFLADAEQQALATHFMDRLQHETLPRVSGLRRQVIHNDLNKHNVLLDRCGRTRVVGLLDFGDMVRGPLVQDLAVACAYQMDGESDALGGAVEVALGYHGVNPLSLQEWGVLPDLIAARQLITVLITGWRAKEHPGNAAYILRNNPLSWRGLRHLKRVGPERASEMFIAASQAMQASTP